MPRSTVTRRAVRSLSTALVAFLLLSTAAGADAPEIVAIKPAGEIMWATDMPGSDYSRFAVEQVFECSNACTADNACLAWTFVSAGIQEERPLCYLKNPIPATAQADGCCVSGIAPEKHWSLWERASPSPAAGIDFGGFWLTETSTGNEYRVWMLQEDNGGYVSGLYFRKSSTQEIWSLGSAAIVGNELHGIWTGDGEGGRFTFIMLPGSETFQGYWTYGDRTVRPDDADGTWEGFLEGRGVHRARDVAKVLHDLELYDEHPTRSDALVVGSVRRDHEVLALPQHCQEGYCLIVTMTEPGSVGWVLGAGLAFR
jgi:hypothetical protein